MTRWLLVVLAGCGGTDGGKVPDTDGPADTDSAGDTDTPRTTETGRHTGDTTPSEAAVTCAPTANPQVFRCAVRPAVAGPTTLTLSAAGLPTRTFHSDEALAEHSILAWGLVAGTSYDWEAEGVSGTVTTGALPPALQTATLAVTGTMSGIDAVLVYVKCGYFVMVDGDGRIVWYLQTTLYDGFSDAMRWSPADRSVLAVTDSTMSSDTSEVGEVDLEWNERLHLTPADFQLELTHDADKWGRYTYLLGETTGRIGGFEVFDGTTRLGQWLLTDGFPGASGLSTAHVNGLTVSESGEVVISAKNFDAILGVDGDPASPTFLQLAWHAVGDPGGGNDLPNPDFVPAPGTSYQDQHNASRYGDELWVFDNASRGPARAVRMQMDFASGELTELDAWSTGQFCPNQGGALPVSGGVLVTCANADTVGLFRDGAATADWQLRPACGGDRPGGASTRAYPVIIE